MIKMKKKLKSLISEIEIKSHHSGISSLDFIGRLKELKQQSIMIHPEKTEKFRKDIRDLRRTIWALEDFQRMREVG